MADKTRVVTRSKEIKSDQLEMTIGVDRLGWNGLARKSIRNRDVDGDWYGTGLAESRFSVID